MPRVLTLLLHAGIATAAWEGLPPPFPALLETAARGAPSFTIPPGEYHFGDLLVDLYELTDFEVEATGVTFWFSKGGGLRFFFCRNLRWGGSHPFAPFAVDYDPPLYSQGRVTRVSDLATSGKVEAVFDAAFPMPSAREAVFAKSRTFKVAFWDPIRRTMRRNPNEGAINLWWQHSLPLGGTRYRLEVGESNKVADYPVPPMVGDLITVAPIGYPHAVSILQSEEVTLQAFHIYGSSSMGILESGGRGGHVYEQVRIGRRDGSDRLLATCADGIHSNGVLRGPTVRSSEIGFTGDGTFNVHNSIAVVIDRLSSTEVVVLDPKKTLGDRLAGESFAFFDTNQNAIVTRPLAAPPLFFEGAGWPERVGGVRETLRRRNFRVSPSLHFTADRVFLLQFHEPLPAAVQAYAALGQGAGLGTGASITDSWLHDSYARMALASASETRMERVLFQRGGGVHIGTEDGFFFLEGDIGGAQGMQLIDSVLEECGSQAVHVLRYSSDVVRRGNTVRGDIEIRTCRASSLAEPVKNETRAVAGAFFEPGEERRVVVV